MLQWGCDGRWFGRSLRPFGGLDGGSSIAVNYDDDDDRSDNDEDADRNDDDEDDDDDEVTWMGRSSVAEKLS